MKLQAILFSLLFILISFCLTYLPQNYLFMLAKSFNVQIMIGYLMLGAILLFTRKWLIASSCFISAIILFIYVSTQVNLLNFNSANSPLLGREPVPLMREVGGEVIKEGRAEVTIANFNVLMYNTNYSATIQSALETKADIISFQEINQKWSNEIETHLKNEYPYYKLLPNEWLYGIGIFSKHPLENVRILNFGDVPNIYAEVLFKSANSDSFHIITSHINIAKYPNQSYSSRILHIITSHTRSPETFAHYKRRDEQLISIAAYLDTISSPQFAIGDYNATPWDETIINFKKQTQLQDSRKNLCPTFPTIFWPAMIPLDYIFYSGNIECLEFKTIDNGDSDHKGIVGKYVIN